MPQSLQRIFRVVLLYLVFAALWVFLTDPLAYFLETAYGWPKVIETYKAALFV